MIVLGSAYRGVTVRLREHVSSSHTIRDPDPQRPIDSQLADVEVLLLGSLRVTAEVMDAAPRLRLIHQHGRGIDGVDLEAATARGVWVANVPQGNSVAVAEHALGLMFVLAKGIHRARASLENAELGAPLTTELSGATLGILGLGGSGSELALRAKALGMRVLATKAEPQRCSVPHSVDKLVGPAEVDGVLAESDFIVVALPLTDATLGSIGRESIARMKPTASLINIARAQIVDYDALYEALAENRISGAAFDVFWGEPANVRDPLLELPNFVLTPHQAGFSYRSVDDVAQVIADNIERLDAGAPLHNTVVSGR